MTQQIKLNVRDVLPMSRLLASVLSLLQEGKPVLLLAATHEQATMLRTDVVEMATLLGIANAEQLLKVEVAKKA